MVVPITKSVWILTSIFAGIFVMGENFQNKDTINIDESSEDFSIIQKNGNPILFSIGIVLIISGLIVHAYLEDVQNENEPVDDNNPTDEIIEIQPLD